MMSNSHAENHERRVRLITPQGTGEPGEIPEHPFTEVVIGQITHEHAVLFDSGKTIKRGFRIEEFDALARELDIPVKQLATTLSINPRTLARRRQAGRLESDESERVLRIQRKCVGMLSTRDGTS